MYFIYLAAVSVQGPIQDEYDVVLLAFSFPKRGLKFLYLKCVKSYRVQHWVWVLSFRLACCIGRAVYTRVEFSVNRGPPLRQREVA